MCVATTKTPDNPEARQHSQPPRLAAKPEGPAPLGRQRGGRHRRTEPDRSNAPELSRRAWIKQGLYALTGLLGTSLAQNGRWRERADNDSDNAGRTRTLLVDVEPLWDRIRPHCPAWHYHLFRQIFVPLRTAAAPPFSLAFAHWVRDWKYNAVGDGVELWLEPDAPLSIFALAEYLERWNKEASGTVIRVLGRDRIVVRSQTRPIWAIFPAFLPHRRAGVTVTWVGENAANRDDGVQNRSVVLASSRLQLVLSPARPETKEAFGNPDRVSIGATLWAARQLLNKQAGTKLLVDRIPRIGCILINPESVPDRDRRRAIAQLFHPLPDRILPAPLYTPANSLFAVGSMERLSGKHQKIAQNVPKPAIEPLFVDLPNHDPLLVQVLTELVDATQGRDVLHLRTVPVKEWEARVSSGNYAVAYWEFDWRFGESPVLDAFRIGRPPTPGTPFLPVRDPTIQALLQLLQQPHSPREWRAAAVELSRTLQREGYVVPLWYVREFARIPAHLGNAVEEVGSLFRVE